jgi:hypothetical protein
MVIHKPEAIERLSTDTVALSMTLPKRPCRESIYEHHEPGATTDLA